MSQYASRCQRNIPLIAVPWQECYSHFGRLKIVEERWRTEGRARPTFAKGSTSKREWSSNGANPIQVPQTLGAPQQSKHLPSSPAESRQLSLQHRTCINPAIRHIASVCDAAFDAVSPITPQHQPDHPVTCTSSKQQWLPKPRQRSAPPPG